MPYSLSPTAPALPAFQTLLVEGDYPATSPLHLCLSHLSLLPVGDLSRPILITASRRGSLINNVSELNDRWLADHVGLGKTADLLSRIRIFYPSTPSHWIFLFSLFGAESQSELYLEHPPSLVVLHEPSAYFLDSPIEDSFTMHSYLRLITCALRCLRNNAAMAVFDSRLEELELPIHLSEDAEGSTRRAVRPVIVKYFDLIGHVQLEQDNIDATYKISLSQDHSLDTHWLWTQVRVPHGGNEALGTKFHCI